jgi:hypothetical protein
MNDDSRHDSRHDDGAEHAHVAAESRLRATLAAVAAATPTEDRSMALLEALDARDADAAASPPAVPVDGVFDLQPLADRRRPGPKVWLLVAAVVAVVAGVVGVTILRDEPREGVVAEQGAVGTGWFLPPDGWEVVSVRTDFLDVGEVGSCPCTYWTAMEVGDDPAAITVQETGAPDALTFDPADGVTDVDVGGRPGQLSTLEPRSDVLAVASSGRQLLVFASGVDPSDLAALADAWLDRTDAGEAPIASELPLPAGFERSPVVVNGAARSVNLVAIRVEETATGRQVDYSVVPTDWYRNMVLGAASSSSVEGGFQVVQVEAGSTAVGIIGGPADIVVGVSAFGEVLPPLPLDELEAFTAGLRQVATADWRAALADADAAGAVEPEVLEASSLYDEPLVDGSSG